MNEEFIFSLMEKFNSGNAVSLDLTMGDNSISLKKEAAFAPKKIVQASAVPQAVPQMQAVSAPAETVKVPSVASPKEDTSGGEFILAPLVGTFYRAPSTDSPAYVEEGATVSKGQPLCILEAMKMMNTLNAEFPCIIEKVLVSNGDLVEFDQPIFKVKRI